MHTADDFSQLRNHSQQFLYLSFSQSHTQAFNILTHLHTQSDAVLYILDTYSDTCIRTHIKHIFNLPRQWKLHFFYNLLLLSPMMLLVIILTHTHTLSHTSHLHTVIAIILQLSSLWIHSLIYLSLLANLYRHTNMCLNHAILDSPYKNWAHTTAFRPNHQNLKQAFNHTTILAVMPFILHSYSHT